MTNCLLSIRAAVGAVFLASVANAVAQDVRLEWLPTGASAKFRYYMPQHLALSPERPSGLRKTPETLTSPLYGELAVGPKESPQKLVLIVDQSSDGLQKLWVDTNGNGDLTDDPATVWEERKSTRNGKESTTYSGTAKLQIPHWEEKAEAQIQLYRFDPAQRADAKTVLMYYRDWGYSGQIVLGGKTYKAMLDDSAASGDFRGKDGPRSGVTLLLDINEDGQFDSKTEWFDTHKPFNIGGTTYEVTGLTAAGTGLKIIKSEKAVEETKPAPVIAVGAKPVSFEAKTTGGQTVRFPNDYKGKVVMLDFWATWCGPCRAELPNVKKVYDELHSKGFEILGISLDSAESLEKLATFTTDNDMPWPQICDGKAWDAELAGKYSVRSIPAAFLIDGTGKITAAGNDLRGDKLRPAVESALGGKNTAGTKPPTKDFRESPKTAARPLSPIRSSRRRKPRRRQGSFSRTKPFWTTANHPCPALSSSPLRPPSPSAVAKWPAWPANTTSVSVGSTTARAVTTGT